MEELANKEKTLKIGLTKSLDSNGIYLIFGLLSHLENESYTSCFVPLSFLR
jgi:hypothetical protein